MKDRYPELDPNDKYLSAMAKIIKYPDFESVVYKILNEKENLTPSEIRAVESLKLECKEMGSDNDNDTFSAGSILAKRRKKSKSSYMNCKFLLPTSNVVERFFSSAGFCLTDHRHRMTPVHYEEQLFLKFNEKLWDEKIVERAYNRPNE